MASNLLIFVIILVIILPSARAQRQLIERLRGAGATRPEAAIPLDGLGRWEVTHLKRFLRVGAIRQTETGGYYLEETALGAHNARKMRQLLIFVGLLLIAAGLAFWLTMRGR